MALLFSYSSITNVWIYRYWNVIWLGIFSFVIASKSSLHLDWQNSRGRGVILTVCYVSRLPPPPSIRENDLNSRQVWYISKSLSLLQHPPQFSRAPLPTYLQNLCLIKEIKQSCAQSAILWWCVSFRQHAWFSSALIMILLW